MADKFDKMMEKSGYVVPERFSRLPSDEDTLILRSDEKNWPAFSVCFLFVVLLSWPLCQRSLLIDMAKKPEDIVIAVSVLGSIDALFVFLCLYNLFGKLLLFFNDKEFWMGTRFFIFRSSPLVEKAAIAHVELTLDSKATADSDESWGVILHMKDGRQRRVFQGEASWEMRWFAKLLSLWAGTPLNATKGADIEDFEEDEP